MAKAVWIGLLVVLLLLLGLTSWVLLLEADHVPRANLDHGRKLPQGDYYVGAVAEPPHLNPFTTRDGVARNQVLRYTHDSLMHLDAKTGVLQPSLATPISSSADGLTTVFCLREGLRFCDGSPLRVEDVLFTYEVSRDRNVVLGSIADSLQRIRLAIRLDDREFKVVLKARHFAGLAGMAIDYPVVQKRYFLAEIRRLARNQGRPAPERPGAPGFGELLHQVRFPGPGTGPYMIPKDPQGRYCWRRQKDLWLVQNPYSWHRQASPKSWNLEGMHLRFLADPAARYTELRKQGLDWYMGSGLERILAEDLKVSAHYRLLEYDYAKLGHHMVIWNHKRPGLDQPEVRRALTMLFDRQAILWDILKGRGHPAGSWFKPGRPEIPEDLESLPYDPEAARELLAKAGFGPGGQRLRLSILAGAGSTFHRQVLELAKPAFDRAGVELEAQLGEWGPQVARRDRGDYDGMLMYWGHSGPFLDPHECFHSAGAQNYMGYANPEVDRLIMAARRELNTVKRIHLYNRLCNILQQEQPVTILVHPKNAVLLHRRFEAAEPGVWGLYPQAWWVPKESQLHPAR